MLLRQKNRGENKSFRFDVAQGSYLRLELCELLGFFVLNLSKDIFGIKNIGLYRYDDLEVLPNYSNVQIKKRKKKISTSFKSLGLCMTVREPLLETVFLDVKLNLNNISYTVYETKCKY